MFFVLLILSYFIGTIPSGILIARWNSIDITEKGSGNVGATNVARVVGKKAGIFTLLLDIAKGVTATLLGYVILGEEQFIWCSVAVVLGHCISIPTVLKGGKGVATALGVLFALNSQLAFFALIIFGAVFYLSRIVSLSSVCAVFSTPLISFFLMPGSQAISGLIVIALILIARHYQNLQRLMYGTEPKFQ